MNLYAESSGVLAWLLDEPSAPAVREALGDADVVLTSELTVIECQRALLRLLHERRTSEVRAADERARLERTVSHWSLLAVSSEVLERGGRPFPVEPIRTLDALHLATALLSRQVVPEIGLLSLDRRIRSCGRALGFEVLPQA